MPTPANNTMKGLPGSVKIQWYSLVKRSTKDKYGVTQHLQVNAYYIPSSSVRLFSPQDYFKHEGTGSFKMDTNGCTFKFATGHEISFKYSANSVLFIVFADIGKGEKGRN